MYTNSTISDFMYLLWAYKMYIGTIDTESAQNELRDKYSKPFNIQSISAETMETIKTAAHEYKAYTDERIFNPVHNPSLEQQWITELIETAKL